MELMNQPFTGQLGNRLIELLESSDYHTLNIVVAFAKNSGVLRLKDSIEKFRARGGIVNIYVGIDMHVTSYEALTALLLHTDSLNVVHSEKSQTFHSKIYQFLGKDKGMMIVGSNNLTAGGLWTNFESSVIIPIEGVIANSTLTMGLENHIGQLSSLEDSFMSIGAQDDIEKLLQNGYVFKEVAERVRLAIAAKQDNPQVRLFGNGVPAKLPGITMPKESTAPAESNSTPSSNEDQVFWIATGAMTSESRNILDLSKKSEVKYGDPTDTLFDLGEKKFMRGTVEFFGLNPIAIKQIKYITLNFEGVDYRDSKVFYPVGNRKNGSWRIQIHGESSSDVKITEVFRDLNAAEGERYNDKGVLLRYLQFKVITFTKIRSDYYIMSVSPESELENFKAASRVLAINGISPSSKEIGIL